MDWQSVAGKERALREAAEAALADVSARFDEQDRALQAAEELAQLGSWVWDIAGGQLTWSTQVHRIFGTDPATLSPTFDVYASVIVPDDRDRVLAVLARAAETGENFQVDYRINRADGQVRDVHSRGRSEPNPAGRPATLIGGVQDITERMAAARELRESRDLFAGVLDAATEQSIIAIGADGLITVFNTGAERLLGYTAAEMLGTDPQRLHDPDELDARAAELGISTGFAVLLVNPAAGRPETRQWTNVTRSGRRLQVSITVTAMRRPDGRVTGFIKVGTDITGRLNAEKALRASEQRLRDTFHYAPHGVMLLGLSKGDLGQILQVNPAMCALTGYSESALLGMNLSELVAPGDLPLHLQRAAEFQSEPNTAIGVERRWSHADGHDLWVQVNINPVRAGSTDPYAVMQVQDITARRQVEAKLRYQALHDGLTGLPNRALLMDRIEHALSVTPRSGRLVAVMYIDLDGFKAINDTAGHASGDRALIHVAEQLRAVLRPSDTVARLGGDEFVVVCDGIEGSGIAVTIADRILAAVGVPLHLDSAVFHLSASVGISLSTSTSTATDLLSNADQAMYQAKGAGKARFHLDGDATGLRVGDLLQSHRNQ